MEKERETCDRVISYEYSLSFALSTTSVCLRALPLLLVHSGLRRRRRRRRLRCSRSNNNKHLEEEEEEEGNA